jgi:HAD superfamily hydrolase (TIGR01509 family)
MTTLSSFALGTEAVIFDLDGVLADTEPVSFQILSDFIAPQEVTWATYQTLIGKSSVDFAIWLKKTYKYSEPAEMLQSTANQYREDRISGMIVPEMLGASALINQLKQSGLKLAVASQSSKKWVDAILNSSNIEHFFDLVITADEVDQPKPAPDIYIQAASRLAVSPRKCIVFEDSLTGVTSALSAGMLTVQLRQATPQPPVAVEADLVINSFAEFLSKYLKSET